MKKSKKRTEERTLRKREYDGKEWESDEEEKARKRPRQDDYDEGSRRDRGRNGDLEEDDMKVEIPEDEEARKEEERKIREERAVNERMAEEVRARTEVLSHWPVEARSDSSLAFLQAPPAPSDTQDVARRPAMPSDDNRVQIGRDMHAGDKIDLLLRQQEELRRQQLELKGTTWWLAPTLFPM